MLKGSPLKVRVYTKLFEGCPTGFSPLHPLLKTGQKLIKFPLFKENFGKSHDVLHCV
jgi:hypothetical protein